MRVYRFVSLLYIVFSSLQSWSQPSICGTPAAMTSFCSNACIICDIDGFTGRNNSSVVGQAPPGFCTSKVHHMQWIGFIAGTTNLTLEVHVTNCNRNQGLEIGLYESLDCNTFRRVSDCDTDIKENETRIFTNTVPLTIGQYYYFVMDGSDDDICDWTIRVLEGSTKVSPLENKPDISVPPVVCQNDTISISTPGLTGATLYNWKVDGATKTGKSFQYAFPKAGNYEICLDAFNVCDQAPRQCTTITVLPVPTQQIKQEICFGECFSLHGYTFCESGIFPIPLKAANGCDSILYLDLTVDDRITATTSLYICEGDTLFLGNGMLTTEGNHQVLIENQEGCDVYMEVNLRLIVCNIQSEDQSVPVRCNGENSGVVRFSIKKGTPPFTYGGYKIENPSVTFSGAINSINQPVVISGVDEGYYYFTIQDTYGNNTALTVFVPQPPDLKLETNISDYNGFGISCAGNKDGFVVYKPLGGSPGYLLQHTFTSEISDTITTLPAGTYESVVVDNNGCRETVKITLKAPDPLVLNTSFSNPNCAGSDTGIIQITSSYGGVLPYSYRLGEGMEQTITLFEELKEGQYSVILTDANGCSETQTILLKAAVIPDIRLSLSTISGILGDSIDLAATVTPPGMRLEWTPSQIIACSGCPLTRARPTGNTDFLLTATSPDGCERRAIVSVSIEKRRSFTIANIISPNGDGINKDITYFAGPDVEAVQYFRLYDRWGNLMMLVDMPGTGVVRLNWSKDPNTDDLNPGVYTYICGVKYIDGKSIVYTGSVTIIR